MYQKVSLQDVLIYVNPNGDQAALRSSSQPN